MGKIRENVLTESNIRALVKMVDEEMDGVAKEQRQKLETIEAELVDVKRRLGRLYDLAETTDLDIDDFKPRIREHRERQERLEATAAEARAMLSQRREVLDDVETITAYALDMSMFLNESELTERRAFIESFVKEIVVMPDNAVVRYTIPMPDDSPIPGRDVEEMALNGSVLSTVKYGGPKLTVDSTIFEMWRDCELPRVCQPTAVDARYKWWQYPTRMCYPDSSLLTVSSAAWPSNDSRSHLRSSRRAMVTVTLSRSWCSLARHSAAPAAASPTSDTATCSGISGSNSGMGSFHRCFCKSRAPN